MYSFHEKKKNKYLIVLSLKTEVCALIFIYYYNDYFNSFLVFYTLQLVVHITFLSSGLSL